MPGKKVPIVLASSSPRRREILRDLQLSFEVLSADIDETPGDGELPEDAALRLARHKAEEVAAKRPSAVVISADTLVALGGEIMGKPKDRQDAKQMLEKLSGRSHMVVTGVAFIHRNSDLFEEHLSTTEVVFRALSAEDIEAYLDTGEYEGKAGAYAIQGHGGDLVRSYTGSWSNVVGLPVTEILKFATSFGWERLPWL